MSDAVVIARGLTKKFGNTTAVNDLNLTIGAGVIYGFLGPNGCGKTTAMRLMTGLLTPTQGEVEVLGSRLPGNAEPLRRQIGYMTQTFSHYRDLSVYENLGFVANIYGLSRAKARARISELLEEYNLTEQAGQRAGSMSGGQKQRLSLAINLPPLKHLKWMASYMFIGTGFKAVNALYLKAAFTSMSTSIKPKNILYSCSPGFFKLRW
ncbi:MAG: ABC transporter ATP-binding protein [Pseudomonadota bacterium]